MSYNTIIYQKEDGIGIITINRPKSMNSLSSELFREMVEVLDQIAVDPEVRVVILTEAKSFLLREQTSLRFVTLPVQSMPTPSLKVPMLLLMDWKILKNR